jgi:3-hydroxyisobutyrate dehydrogenase-like beta-hydroxyacid dehydrogenase
MDAIDIMNRLMFDSFAEFRDIIASHTDNRGRISLTKKEFNYAADEALEAHAQKNVAELIHKFYTDTPESD